MVLGLCRMGAGKDATVAWHWMVVAVVPSIEVLSLTTYTRRLSLCLSIIHLVFMRVILEEVP